MKQSFFLADFDGINLIAIQALEKRTKMLNTESKTLIAENNQLKEELVQLKASLQRENERLAKEIHDLEKLLLQATTAGAVSQRRTALK